MQSNSELQIENFIPNEQKLCESLADRQRSKRKDNLFFLGISFIALAIILTITILNTYVFFIADVSGSSMYPTLVDDDKLIANRYKEPYVDAIVTIKHGDELWIKRVIAMGGDTVEIKDGYVFVNGKTKDEPYLERQGITEVKTLNNKWVLKEDEIFYLGDNRTWSSDAREHGPCKVSDIVGVIEKWSLWFNELKK